MAMISTKGRYALRVMTEIAEKGGTGNYISLRTIAEDQEISEKYLEAITADLVKAGLVEGVRGKGGGYRLTKAPSDYTVKEILDVTETTMAPVSCLNGDINTCPRAVKCRTLPIWKNLQAVVDNYLSGVTLADVMEVGDNGDYVI
jgi:Rrf2 family iron-sulfur cluster assembly transcriptional regulator